MAGPQPYLCTYGFSNLTRIPLPDGAEDLLWTQTPNPLLPGPILLAICGHAAGVRIVAGWREGYIFSKHHLSETDILLNQILRSLPTGRSKVRDLLQDTQFHECVSKA